MANAELNKTQAVNDEIPTQIETNKQTNEENLMDINGGGFTAITR